MESMGEAVTIDEEIRGVREVPVAVRRVVAVTGMRVVIGIRVAIRVAVGIAAPVVVVVALGV
jgi:hypothetical protein